MLSLLYNTAAFLNRYRRPRCPYDSSHLSFAIHIRLGDRGSGQHAITEEYRKRLDAFMYTVTKAVEAEGQPPPLFHIFSQTDEPCPSEETGAFAEFPKWPLDSKEVRIGRSNFVGSHSL